MILWNNYYMIRIFLPEGDGTKIIFHNGFSFPSEPFSRENHGKRGEG